MFFLFELLIIKDMEQKVRIKKNVVPFSKQNKKLEVTLINYSSFGQIIISSLNTDSRIDHIGLYYGSESPNT